MLLVGGLPERGGRTIAACGSWSTMTALPYANHLQLTFVGKNNRLAIGVSHWNTIRLLSAGHTSFTSVESEKGLKSIAFKGYNSIRAGRLIALSETSEGEAAYQAV